MLNVDVQRMSSCQSRLIETKGKRSFIALNINTEGGICTIYITNAMELDMLHNAVEQLEDLVEIHPEVIGRKV